MQGGGDARTFGKVIFVDARCCRSNSPVDMSNKKTEKARCRIARGWAGLNSWEVLLDAEPMTLSFSSKTSTVSFAIMSSWDMALPFHVVVDMTIGDDDDYDDGQLCYWCTVTVGLCLLWVMPFVKNLPWMDASMRLSLLCLHLVCGCFPQRNRRQQTMTRENFGGRELIS
jgi:hypothetical protein